MASHKYELGSKMRIGALWIYLQGGTSSVIRFAAGIILARILDPSDFGVFYAVTAYTALLLLQTRFGIPSSLIKHKNVTEAQWNAAFWFMQGVALLCVIAIVMLSSWLQGFYSDDRFTIIMWLMSVTLILAPISAILDTRLRREMDYKSVSKVQIIVGLLSVVISIICALMGFGPFSFVIAGIISAIVFIILLARRTSWRPYWPVDHRGLGSIMSYSWRLHLNNSLNMGANKVDNMLVGNLVGISALGIYNRALSSAQMPVTEISGRLYQLFFTSLSRIQDDMKHTIQMYKKVLCAMTNAVFPFLLVFIFAAESFIHVLYGEKWLLAAEPLQILALGAMPKVISITMGALANSQGLVHKVTPVETFNLIFTAAAVWIGSNWGLTGVATGVALKPILIMLILQFMMSRSHLNLRWGILMEGSTPAIVSSVVASAVALMMINLMEQTLEPTGILYLGILTLGIFLSYGATLLAYSRLFPDNEALAANIDMFHDALIKLRKKVFRQKTD